MDLKGYASMSAQKYLVLMSFLESKIHFCDTPQAFELLSHSPSHRLFEQMTHIFLAGPSYWGDSIEDFFPLSCVYFK